MRLATHRTATPDVALNCAVNVYPYNGNMMRRHYGGVNGNSYVDLGDVGKVILVYSGVL